MRIFLACVLAALVLTSRAADAGLANLSAAADATQALDRLPRRALVIGVTNYEWINEIRNGVNDAKLIASSLEKLGFEVDLVTNPTRTEFLNAISRHNRRIGNGALSVFYYGGQGGMIGKTSYMAAIDAEIHSARLEAVGVPFEDTMAAFQAAGKEVVSIAFFDSSRTNPYDTGSRGISIESVTREGGAAIPADDLPVAEQDSEPPPPPPDISGSVLYYSTGPGGDASDGEGDNGPFALAVAEVLAKPGLDQAQFFRELRNAVVDSTNGAQVPDFADDSPVPVILNRSLVLAAAETAETRAAKALYESKPGELTPTYEDGSYALLIGVSDYAMKDGKQAWRDLPAVKDETLRLAKVLKDVHGFEVETLLDPTSDELEHALEFFVNRNGAKPNARLVISMSGHGATTTRFDNKVAWFVPSDAPAMNPPAPFLNTALNLRRIEEWSEVMEAKHVLWIFDSCFSGAAIKMIDRKAADDLDDGWSVHLTTHPVRRVITAGSENEEVPAKSRFMERLIDVLSGQQTLGNGSMVTGRQIGDFLREDLIRYAYKQGLPPETPQSDTIVIPNEEGDIIFRLEPELAAAWEGDATAAAE